MEKVLLIKERLKMTQSHQNSYTDMMKRELEFSTCCFLYIKVSIMKEVKRFGKQGAQHHFMVPHEIIGHYGKVAYDLELSSDFIAVHLVFHVTLLKKRIGEPVSFIPFENISVKYSLSNEEVPVETFDL